jgi:preprotein translocase subunit SecE
VVVVTVFLFAAYFEAVDLVIGKGIDQLLAHLTKH